MQAVQVWSCLSLLQTLGMKQYGGQVRDLCGSIAIFTWTWSWGLSDHLHFSILEQSSREIKMTKVTDMIASFNCKEVFVGNLCVLFRFVFKSLHLLKPSRSKISYNFDLCRSHPLVKFSMWFMFRVLTEFRAVDWSSLRHVALAWHFQLHSQTLAPVNHSFIANHAVCHFKVSESELRCKVTRGWSEEGLFLFQWSHRRLQCCLCSNA